MHEVRPDLRDKIFAKFKELNYTPPEFMLIAIRDETNIESDVINDKLGYIKGNEISLCPGTTDPGLYWMNNPMNSDGCAHIVSNVLYPQVYRLGLHGKKGSDTAHDAFVQYGELTVARSKTLKEYTSGIYKLYTGKNFMTNYHAMLGRLQKIGRWSAGCLVCQYIEDLNHTIAMFKTTQMYKKNKLAAVDLYIFTKSEGIW
jgi:hypothetical protein